MTSLDPRLTPARPDLAAAHLRGQVEAARFVEGRRFFVCEGVVDLRRAPSPDAPVDTQALYGESVMLYEDEEGFGFVQLARDAYVGYISMLALAEGSPTVTHWLRVGRSFVYPAANMKLPVLAALPLNAGVEVIGEEGAYMRLATGGFIYADHLIAANATEEDFVSVAERLIGAPYLWGGKSSLGVDCSGLVQVSLQAAGIEAPRDTDMQEKALGSSLTIGDDLQGLRRGDLIFWKGHVGIMRSASELLHANGHHMLVASEPLVEARDRILAKSFGPIASIKRL
jgi:cell wall-associated NlpC family hydrolase